MISKYYVVDGTPVRVFLPDNWKYDETRSAALISFGMGDDPEYVMTTEEFWHLAEDITDNENAVIVGTWGGFLFGNPVAQSLIASAVEIAVDELGVKPGGIIPVGFSMGGTNVLAYSGNNPTEVFGVIGIAPLTDLNLVPSNFPELVAAYPGGYSDGTYGEQCNPLIKAEAGDYEGMPIHIFWGTLDEQISLGSLQDFQTEVNDQVTIAEVNLLEHNWMSVMHPDVVCGILNMLDFSDDA